MTPILESLFLNPETYASSLYAAAVKELGPDIHEFEVETIWADLEDDLPEPMPAQNKDKIAAAITVLTSDRYYEDFRAFEGLTKALVGQSPNFDYITPLTVAEIAWGISEVALFDATFEPFSEEIKVYVRQVLKDEGFLTAPELLSFCELEKEINIEDYLTEELRESVEEQQKIKHLKVKVFLEEANNRKAEELTKIKS